MLLLATKVWEQRKLGEIGKIIAGGDKDSKKLRKKGKYPVLANNLENNGIIGYYKNNYKIEAPAITVTARGNIGNAIARFTNFTPVVRLLVLKTNLDVKFIEQSINNINFFIESTGVPQLTVPQLASYSIFIPKKFEQHKIGNLFKFIDNIVALYAKKSSCLDSCIAYFIRTFYDYQQFFKQKNVQSSIVKSFKLNDILIKNNIRNKDSSILNVESISNKEGFISQKEQFDNYQVASKDLSNYYVIHPKDFAYNPSRINVGSIAYKNSNDVKGIVSPLYVSFKCKNDIILDKYLWYWFKSANFEHQRVRLSEGGVRDTLSFNQLSKMKISIPSFEIQKQTIKFLEILIQYKEEIDLKLNNLKLIKNTLLQSMFL